MTLWLGERGGDVEVRDAVPAGGGADGAESAGAGAGRRDRDQAVHVRHRKIIRWANY